MDKSLYLVLSSEYRKDLLPLDIAERAINGGIKVLQMREKNLKHKDATALAREYSLLCKRHNVTFIVNDDPQLCVDAGANGLHLGQEDVKNITLAKAREIIGKDRIIGLSTHSLEEFRIANESGVDYIAFGPLFETKTKSYSIGLGDIDKVVKEAKKPVVFIGGINVGNIDDILSLGGRNIAVIREIMCAGDIKARAKMLNAKMQERFKRAVGIAKGGLGG
ncbi:MAG: thiamine phosphate synthase [Candidatus Omnitrophica bacterium]|nr:thiamine phosphate synthase [Candidatus Omnitrophota bacterium]